MSDCLSGKSEIPDRREKLVDWDVFTSLMLSTWIRRFTKDVPIANQVADQWADMIMRAILPLIRMFLEEKPEAPD